MEVEMIPVAIALGSVCIAVYKDLKDRTIPNKLTYPLIVVGIAFYLLLGGYHWDLYLALSGGIGAGIAFGIGYLLYITGAWAGGDVKLFTALGALLPKSEAPSISILLSADYPLFPLTLLLNSLILAVPVLLLYAVISRLRGGGAFYEEIKLSELEEGAIPAETIYEKDGQIGRYSSFLGFLSELGAPKWDRKFTDPRRAAGVTKDQVKTLSKFVREGRIEDRIRIKKGVPFALAIGAGTFVGIFYGGIYCRIISWMISWMAGM